MGLILMSVLLYRQAISSEPQKCIFVYSTMIETFRGSRGVVFYNFRNFRKNSFGLAKNLCNTHYTTYMASWERHGTKNWIPDEKILEVCDKPQYLWRSLIFRNLNLHFLRTLIWKILISRKIKWGINREAHQHNTTIWRCHVSSSLSGRCCWRIFTHRNRMN